jgi:hypothetical protein
MNAIGIGVNLDIDEWMRAEEALRRSESYLAEAQRVSQCEAIEPPRRSVLRCALGVKTPQSIAVLRFLSGS